MPILSITSSSPIEHLSQLDALIQDTFGFTFAAWREGGWWPADYTVYGLFEAGQLSACAGAYRCELLVRGEIKVAIQIGSVATRKACQGRGLSRQVIEHLLAQYPATPAFLCANETVLDFYPRFGFRPVEVKEMLVELADFLGSPPSAAALTPFPHQGGKGSREEGGFPPLPSPVCGREAGGEGLSWLLQRGAYSAIFDCTNAASINAFHLLLDPTLCLCELPSLDALLISQQEGETLHLLDVIARRPLPFADLAPYLAFPDQHFRPTVRKVRFGFNPDWLGVNGDWSAPAEDPHLFVRGDLDLPAAFTLPALMTT